MQRTSNDSVNRPEKTSAEAYRTREALNRVERSTSGQPAGGRSVTRSATLRTGSNNAARTSSAQAGNRSASVERRSALNTSRPNTPQRRSTSYDGYLDEAGKTARSASQQRTGRTRSASDTQRTRTGTSKRPAAGTQRRPAGSAKAGRSASGTTRRPSSAQRSVPSATRRRPTGKRPVKKSVKRSNFKRFLMVYSAILLIVLIVGLLIFNSFIGNYEKNQPVNIAKNVAEELNTDAASFLNDHKEFISSMADTDEVIDKYVNAISGKELSYIENSDSRAEAPSFDLRADGSTMGKITLEPDGKGSFGLAKWKLAGMNIAEYIPDTYAYTILAPSGYTLAINGNELSESAITAHDETPELLANAAQFIKTVPKYDSYTVSGLLSIPTVTAKDASGTEVGVAAAQEYFVAGGEPSKDFIADRKDFVENALTSWAYHFINYSNGQSPLSNYVQSGSDLYAYIFGSDTMDPIYTGFYEYESITKVEFTEFEAKNYIQYADDCFSVDVKYRLKVDFNNNNLSDDGQMLDATWVIVHNNNYWGIADVIYHQGSESSLANEVASQDNAAAETTAAADTEETTAEDTTTEK